MKKRNRSSTPKRKRKRKKDTKCSVNIVDTILFLIVGYYIVNFVQSYKV